MALTEQHEWLAALPTNVPSHAGRVYLFYKDGQSPSVAVGAAVSEGGSVPSASPTSAGTRTRSSSGLMVAGTWRALDGYFCLLYAGRTVGVSFAGRGDCRLGRARSRGDGTKVPSRLAHPVA